jgi:ribosomal protein S12 methylthiotransferase
VLKAMRRPANQDKTLERIRSWRSEVPDLTLRSTFIVGFPGETDADFGTLLAFLEEAELDRVGCFKYEPVQGAKANALEGAVPDKIKAERYDRLMALQQTISTRKLASKIGRQMDVLIDEVDEDGAVARSFADAPEIDGNVFLPPSKGIAPGMIVPVRIEEADEYDLYGRRVV